MPDCNKRNIEFFESTSMKGLYEEMEQWQKDNTKRFLSMEVHNENGIFSCICLTNPTEVTIVSSEGKAVDVSNDGCLWVRRADLST